MTINNIVLKRITLLTKFIEKIETCFQKSRTFIKEIEFLENNILAIDKQISNSYSLSLLSTIEYKKYKTDVADSLKQTYFLYKNPLYKYLSTNTIHSYLLLISKLKSNIIYLSTRTGTTDVYNIYKCIRNEYYSNSNTLVISRYLKLISNIFNVIRVDYYKEDCRDGGKITFVYTNRKKQQNKIVCNEETLENVLFTKLLVSSKQVFLSLKGCRLIIPLKDQVPNTVLVCTGYFIDNPICVNEYSFIQKKLDRVDTIAKNLEYVSNEFIDNYIKHMSIRDLLVYSSDEILVKLKSDYDTLEKYKQIPIGDLAKMISEQSVVASIYTIKLLMAENNLNSTNIANLCLELLKSSGSAYNLVELMNSLDSETRNRLNSNVVSIASTESVVDTNINYEKSIQSMCVDSSIKHKALDKLKEINNNKNSDNNAKAIQYLDGLLKIPFGIYKKEYLKIKLEALHKQFSKLLDKVLTQLNEISKKVEPYKNLIEMLSKEVERFKTKSFHPLHLEYFITKIKSHIENIENTKLAILTIYDKQNLENRLKLVNKKTISALLGIDITRSIGKKLETIDINYDMFKILNEIVKLPTKMNYLNNSENWLKVKEYFQELFRDWASYKEQQNKYFLEIGANLDSAVYGSNDAKTQIKRLIAQWINGKDKGYVFGLEGPPGTGKTTLAKDGIAKCLRDESGHSRPIVFIPLGGSSNGSTLEGHNYTYVGSTWGKIVDGLMESRCMNPIIYIDELDKISKTEHGKELIGILTHLTDPAQNGEFTDKYFSGIPIDLSKCLIIFSYNDPDLIDKILLDRIQRIHVEPLTKNDKLMVAKNHIIPEIVSNIGLSIEDIVISDSILEYIVDTYTYEAGARKLKEKLYELFRETNLGYFENKFTSLPIEIDKTLVERVFENSSKIEPQKIHSEPKVGLINGLYATSSGLGGITIIEAFRFYTSSHLELKLTGMQGDVMKESMNVAKTLALNLIPNHILEELREDKKEKANHSANPFGIHIHCPAGATPKDGPSAGTAITLAILSMLCRLPIKNTIGITGEIDLNGNVLPIGGLESKILGGKEAGVSRVLYPIKNNDDFVRISKKIDLDIGEHFQVTSISNIYEAIDYCLVLPEGQKAITYFREV